METTRGTLAPSSGLLGNMIKKRKRWLMGVYLSVSCSTTSLYSSISAVQSNNMITD